MKLSHIFLLLFLMSGIASCKKDLISNPGQYSKIYMPQAVDSPAVRSLYMADTLQSIVFGAEFGGVENLSQDVTVQFKADLSAVDAYNNAHKTTYLPMPADAYELTGTEAVIRSGELNSDPLKIKVKTVGGIEPLKEYLLPVTILNADTDIPVNEKLRTAYFVIQGTYQDFNRTDWSVYEFSSEDNVQVAPLVLDGNTTTMWHTKWRGGTVNPPHYIALDMKKEFNMHGIYTWPDNRTTMAPKDIHVEVSKDGQNWTAAGDYSLPNTNERHTLYFDTPKLARYFKITINTMHSNTPNKGVTRLTEIGAF